MWLIILGLGLGITLGFLSPVTIPITLSKYFAVAILAALDSCIGGFRAGIEKFFRLSIFLSGFFFNIIVATVLVYLGDLLGIDLYLAAIFVFGIRIFNNITSIRIMWIDKYWIAPKREKEEQKEKKLKEQNFEI